MRTETASQEVHFGDRRIAYRLHRSARRRLRIVVSPRMEVDVYAPLGAKPEVVLAAVRRKASWIVRALDGAAAFQPLPGPKRFVSGETLVYLGRQYRLRVRPGPHQGIRLHGRFLDVTVPEGQSPRAVRCAVERWYRERAVEVIARHVGACAAIASRHGVPAAPVVIRKMRTRWGSCTAAGRITVNVNLVQAPVHGIQYVIMHELCHLLHHEVLREDRRHHFGRDRLLGAGVERRGERLGEVREEVVPGFRNVRLSQVKTRLHR